MYTFARLIMVAAAFATSNVLAAPSIKVERAAAYPEFIPPPGFPSLAELNVTTEMLRTTKPKALGDFTIQLNAQCGGLATANVDDVIVCFNFLEALGTYVISVSDSDYYGKDLAGVRQVAQYGTAFVLVQTMTGNTASSYSSDVGLAVQWVFTNCNSGGWVSGTAPANGNGDIRVWTSGTPPDRV